MTLPIITPIYLSMVVNDVNIKTEDIGLNILKNMFYICIKYPINPGFKILCLMLIE